jgi:hypothetical protein
VICTLTYSHIRRQIHIVAALVLLGYLQHRAVSNMSFTQAKPTGSFDLPLELCQQIYRDCLPTSRYSQERSTFLLPELEELKNFREADPRITNELCEEQRKTVEVVEVYIEAAAWEAPQPFEFPRLKTVDILFERYPVSAASTENALRLCTDIPRNE